MAKYGNGCIPTEKRLEKKMYKRISSLRQKKEQSYNFNR